MKPRPVTEDDLFLWAENSGFQVTPKRIVMHAPPTLQGEVGDLEAVFDGTHVRSPWVADERDDAAIPPSLTLWLSCMGGQPPVDLVFISQLDAVVEATEAVQDAEQKIEEEEQFGEA